MNYHQTYSGLIFTNHAIERMKARGLSQEMAWSAWKSPDQSLSGKNPGSIEYVKQVDTHRITLIAKQNERGEWIVLSTWVDPPFPGSIDVKKREQYQNYQKASFLGKLWLTLRSQIGI